MKRYIRNVSSLQTLQDIVVDRLSVPGVANVEILKANSNNIHGKLHYEDGTVSDQFEVTYRSSQNRSEATTTWNPQWHVKDDGAVVDESGEIQGYFKLLKQRPQTTSRQYDENSLVIYYGVQSAKLSDDSAATIAKNLHK